MIKTKIEIGNIPAIIYGENSDKLYIFVHGKHSKKEDTEIFANIVDKADYQVISFDLPEHGERKNEQYPCTIQNGEQDLKSIYSFVKDKYKIISLYACSLGAYFSLSAFQNIKFNNCLFVSPILNMERLIQNMMKWSNVSEKELKEKAEIETSFGEILSWDYYQYVQNNPIKKWDSKTFILYGENDNMTEKSILQSFSEKYNCEINIMPNGEHYFHTEEQLNYMESWIKRVIE